MAGKKLASLALAVVLALSLLVVPAGGGGEWGGGPPGRGARGL